MKESNLEFIQIEAKGFQDLCKHIAELEEENKQLKAELESNAEELTNFISEIEDLECKVDRLNRMKQGLRINNSALTLERNTLLDELNRIKSMSMFEFGNTYCSDESLAADGKAFARSLLGKPTTEEEAIANGEEHYAKFCGDDY